MSSTFDEPVQHGARSMSASLEQYKCPECNKFFKSSKGLKIHFGLMHKKKHTQQSPTLIQGRRDTPKASVSGLGVSESSVGGYSEDGGSRHKPLQSTAQKKEEVTLQLLEVEVYYRRLQCFKLEKELGLPSSPITTPLLHITVDEVPPPKHGAVFKVQSVPDHLDYKY